MLSIKDSITRLSKAVRQIESITPVKRSDKSSTEFKKVDGSKEKTVRYKSDRSIPVTDLRRFKPLAREYNQGMFKEFLEPLNIPTLKSLQKERNRYPVEKARDNWKRKNNSVYEFQLFLENQAKFKKMVELLVELTPEELKSPENTTNHIVLKRLLTKNKEEVLNSRIEGIPEFYFGEIPPIPKPLTAESFERYIYFLTHLKILYKNSSSFKTGIIPHILLHTHKLSNEEYKPYRSANTFNYLIKYFGYDKHQSRFARELSLAMKIDGHSLNVESINNLIKLVKKQSNIRSLESSYSRICKYLKIAKLLRLQVNLTTWNRVYDCIDNTMLKEAFIQRIIQSNIPINENLSYRILDDYMKILGRDNLPQVINFIEQDLKIKDWGKNSVLLNKVLYYSIVNCKLNLEFREIWEKLIINPRTKIDKDSMSKILLGMKQNEYFNNDKITFMLTIYCKLQNNSKFNKLDTCPYVFRHIITEICRIAGPYELDKLGKVIRILVHEEATKELGLPIEVTKYIKEHVPPRRGALSKNDEFNFKKFIPEEVCENFKIMKRLIGLRLNSFEGNFIYYQWIKLRLDQNNGIIKYLSDSLTEKEIQEWQILKNQLVQINFDQVSRFKEQIGEVINETISIPRGIGTKYEKIQFAKLNKSELRDKLYQINQGPKEYFELQMKERGIIY